jgi:hypothetical protein
VGFVGQSLEGNQEIPEEVIARFQELWSLYWAGAGKKDAQEKPDALLFGTWFSSGQFPEQWALEQLENFVEVTPTPEPDHAIAEQLAKIAQTDIVRAVRILDWMVQGDREGWRIHGWLVAAKQTLETAMRAGGDARTHAEQVLTIWGDVAIPVSVNCLTLKIRPTRYRGSWSTLCKEACSHSDSFLRLCPYPPSWYVENPEGMNVTCVSDGKALL